MVPGQGDGSVAVETPWISGNMVRVLAELQNSGTIYFQKSLTPSSGRHDQNLGPDVELVLPLSFLQEHGDKFEEYVIFRTRSSPKPSVVEVSIFEEPHCAPEVRFAGGWEEFAADNRLKQGDSLIFVLKVPLPEFMVYIFRATGRDSSSPARNWANTDHCTSISEQIARSLSHEQQQQKKVKRTGDLWLEQKAGQEGQQTRADSFSDREQNLGHTSSEVDIGKDSASQRGTNSLGPDFHRRLTASTFRDGRIEVPASFVKTHGKELQGGDVKVQGIHRESPIRVMTLRRTELGKQTRLYLQGG